MIYLLIALIILLNLGDFASTLIALAKSNTYEANPIVQRFGLIPTKVVATILQIAVLVVLSITNPSLMVPLTTGITLFYAWVIYHNLTVKR